MNEIVARAKSNPKVIVRGIIALVVAAILVAGVWILVSTLQRAAGYDKIKQENEELQTALADTTSKLTDTTSELEGTEKKLSKAQEELTYEKGQVKQYKESTNALTQQVAGLNAEKEDLENQLEALLHVEEELPVITRADLEWKLDSISELVSQEYMYRNASKKEASKTWLWGVTMPLSNASLLATYDGTIKAGIDLKEVKINVNETNRIITVTIPPCKVLDHNIPQETINVLEVKNSLFNEFTFNDYNKFIAAEKPEMEKQAIERGFLTNANENAREIIKVFLGSLPGIDTYTLKFN